jgi:two-component system LytT family response regulator
VPDAEGRVTVALVDDEAPARSLLREYLAAHSDVVVVADCANGFEGVKALTELKPDLVFLDVQMPKLDGFEVLELIGPGPVVIFCTAYDEYALRAFEVHAVDYLLKPFGRERLAEALTRARARLGEARTGSTAVSPSPSRPGELAAAARPPGHWIERVVIKDGSRVQVIPVERIDYLEAQDDYVAIQSEGRTWLKTQPLAELARGLDPDRFVRIHRSYVLNLERLARLEPYAKDSRMAILENGKELPVSRAGYARLKELM